VPFNAVRSSYVCMCGCNTVRFSYVRMCTGSKSPRRCVSGGARRTITRPGHLWIRLSFVRYRRHRQAEYKGGLQSRRSWRSRLRVRGHAIWSDNGLWDYGIAKVDLFKDLEAADPRVAGNMHEADGENAKGARLLLLYEPPGAVEVNIN
jgi:hypothetical protein